MGMPAEEPTEKEQVKIVKPEVIENPVIVTETPVVVEKK